MKVSVDVILRSLWMKIIRIFEALFSQNSFLISLRLNHLTTKEIGKKIWWEIGNFSSLHLMGEAKGSEEGGWLFCADFERISTFFKKINNLKKVLMVWSLNNSTFINIFAPFNPTHITTSSINFQLLLTSFDWSCHPISVFTFNPESLRRFYVLQVTCLFKPKCLEDEIGCRENKINMKFFFWNVKSKTSEK